MKKCFLFAVLAVALAACSQESEEMVMGNEQLEEQTVTMSFAADDWNEFDTVEY